MKVRERDELIGCSREVEPIDGPRIEYDGVERRKEKVEMRIKWHEVNNSQG